MCRFSMAIVLAATMATAGSGRSFAQNVGDLVIVTSATSLKEGDKVIRKLGRGSLFAVQAVDGKWLWPASAKPGWINSRDVVPVAEAARLFEEAIQKDPKDIEAYIARASIAESRKEWDAAIGDIDQAIKLAPEAPELLVTRARILMQRGDYEKALGDCEAAMGINPKVGPIYRMRGEVLSAKGDYKKALADFDEAIRLDPEDAGAFSNRGWLRSTCPDSGVRDAEAALMDARTSCELTAYKHYRGLNTLAAAYAEAGKFGQAVKWQMRALEMAPLNYREAYRKRVDLYADEKPFRESHGTDT